MMNAKQLEMKEYMLNKIEGVDRTNMDRACIQFSARGVGYCVKTAEPNVIYYWVTRYGIKGSIRY
jgi:hypothetical protein